MKFFFSYLHRRWKGICVVCLLCASTALMFYLYNLDWEPFTYILVFWLFLCFPVFLLDFRNYRRRHCGLVQLAQNPEEAAQCLPPLSQPGGAGLSSPHSRHLRQPHPSDR